MSWPLETRRTWIVSDENLSIGTQCRLLGLARSTYYYTPAPESEENLRLMRLIDELYLKRPFYGSPRMTGELRDMGWKVNEKRIARLMRVMGLQAIVPGPHTSKPHPEHRIYPYLLRNLDIARPNQVWCADITYVPMSRGFLYLMAVMDWFSRYVLAWKLSNTLETTFCVEGLDRALRKGRPEIFNTDQGAQFTSEDFTGRLMSSDIRISMDGRGRATDNIMVERLWRSVKYEEIYPRDYVDGIEAWKSLRDYFRFYNTRRRHQALERRTPAEVFFG